MAFEPTSAISEQDGNTVRLYAAPRWVRPDGPRGLWRPIQSLITPAGGGYDVLGPRGVASFRPAKRPAGGLAAAVIEGHQFGDEIILANVEPVVEYAVTPPPEAVEVENGWSLGSWDGIQIGLFFDDWIQRFGERFSRRGTLLSLDLSPEKEAASPGDTLSLDPSIAVANYAMHSKSTAVWATVRDSATSSSSSGSVISVQGSRSGPIYFINRSCLRFDTSAYIPLTAYLFINTSNTGTDVYLARSKNGFATPLTTNTNYAEVKTSYGDAGSQVGVMVSAGSNWYKSADLIAANRWAATTTYDLCLAENAKDVLNVTPTGANSITISTGANQPYLLLALPFVGHHAVGRGVGNGVHMGVG